METKPTITFDNQYVLSRIEENKISKNLKIIQELKQIAPLLSDIELLQLYNKSISIHQSKIQGNGNFLENDILVCVLDKNKIHYKKQVIINKSGIIVRFNEKKVTINKSGIIVRFNEKKGKCFHIIDFVIGENIEVGKSTLVDYLKNNYTDKNIVYLQEPVDEWNNIKDENNITILEKFYANQTKYSFAFQMMAYISRLDLLRNSIKNNPNSIIITERSLFTDKYVFAQMLYDSKKMEKIENDCFKRAVFFYV